MKRFFQILALTLLLATQAFAADSGINSMDLPSASSTSGKYFYLFGPNSAEKLPASSLDPAGAGDAAVANHEDKADPHPNYMRKSVYDTDLNSIVDRAASIDDGAGNVKTAAEVTGQLPSVDEKAALSGVETAPSDSNPFTTEVDSVRRINSITDLRGVSGHDGQIVQVIGYSTAGDVGGGDFIWQDGDWSTEVTAQIVNGTQTYGLYVAPNSDATGASGVWKRLYQGSINVKWFGAVGDNSADDTDRVQSAENIRAIEHGKLFFPYGTYLVDIVTADNASGVEWEGEGEYLTTIKTINQTSYIQFGSTSYRSNRAKIKGISFHGNNTADIVVKFIRTTFDVTDCEIRYSGSTLAELLSVYNSKFTRVRFTEYESQPLNSTRTYDYEFYIGKDSSDTYSSNMINFNDCIFENYKQDLFNLVGNGSIRTAHIFYDMCKFETDQPLTLWTTATFQGLHISKSTIQMNRSTLGNVPVVSAGVGSNGFYFSNDYVFHNASTANGSLYNPFLETVDYAIGPILFSTFEMSTDGSSTTDPLISLPSNDLTNLQGLSLFNTTINRRPIYNLAGQTTYNSYDINSVSSVLNIVADDAVTRFNMRRIGAITNNYNTVLTTDGVDFYDKTGLYQRVNIDGSQVEYYRPVKVPGTWESPFMMASARLWINATSGKVYIKNGSDPTSDTDGIIVGTQN